YCRRNGAGAGARAGQDDRDDPVRFRDALPLLAVQSGLAGIEGTQGAGVASPLNGALNHHISNEISTEWTVSTTLAPCRKTARIDATGPDRSDGAGMRLSARLARSGVR